MKKYLSFIVLVCSFAYVNAGATELYLSLESNKRTQSCVTNAEIKREKIENKNAVAAMDLIDDVTGIFVTKAASQMKSDISIRGVGDSFRKIGLFINGRPEKMAVYGCGVSQTLLSGNIEKIEIIKSPDSVLFGGDGFGGVINIITAKPAKAFEGEVSTSYGTFNTQSHYLSLGGNVEKAAYSFSVNRNSGDGHLHNAGYDATDYYGSFTFKIDDINEITVNGKYFTGTELEPKASTVTSAGVIVSDKRTYWYDFIRGGADIRYKKYFNNGSIEIMGYGDWGEHLFSDGFNSKDSMYGVNARVENKFLEKNTLKYGAEYRLSDGKVMSGVKTGEWKKSEIAIYVLDEHKFFDKLTAVFGARYNYDEISGNVFVPRASLAYDITSKLIIRSLYSRGFRAPYINELYSLPSSNDKLESEIQNNYEIGINSKYLGIDFDITAFVINGDNIIQAVQNTPAPPAMRFKNAGAYVFKGFEISAEGKIVKNLNGYAGFSYLDPDKLTQGIVKSKIDLSLDYKIYKFTFYVSAMFVKDYYASNNAKAKLDDFNVFNAKIHYNLLKKLTIFAAVDNFTNQKYEMFIVSFGNARIYEMPGTAATIGAKYKF